MTRTAIVAASLLLILATISRANAQSDAEAAIVKAARHYIETGDGDVLRLKTQFRRLPVELAEDVLAEELKSRDAAVLERALLLALSSDCSRIVKQCEKLTKSKEEVVSRYAVLVVLSRGDIKQRKKALAQFMDAPNASGDSTTLTIMNQSVFSAKFASELEAALKKSKSPDSTNAKVVERWLAELLGRPDLEKSALLKDYDDLLKQQETRVKRTEELAQGMDYELVGSLSNDEFDKATLASAHLTADGTKFLVMITPDENDDAPAVHCFEFGTGKRVFTSPRIQSQYPQLLGLRESVNEFVVKAGAELQRYSLADGTLKAAVRMEDTGSVCSICNEGNELALSSEDRVWVADIETGKTTRELFKGAGKPFNEFCATSEDGKLLAVSFWTGNGDEHVTRIFDVPVGKELAKLENAGQCLGIGPDNKLIVRLDRPFKHQRIMDFKTGKVLACMERGDTDMRVPNHPMRSWCLETEDDAVCHVVSTETGRICASVRVPCDNRVRLDPVTAQISTDGSQIVAISGSYFAYGSFGNESADNDRHARIYFWRRKAR
ncbi:MAG: hypothetical protein ICCCNLDF_01701 [Planctomycetes bacterium]|nr:hypothetical protein [Planctomycetota bacterium]